ncbi:hypothetical protein T02_3345 [Trichinella nativa]|uniref:Uncharacterized protein n=1 Tax=Trichinella nativa TaxID=6335 RepID=A0A0V1KM37_9BILA|nr:hypothetical protein T02_3345 [Trichinella nativa]
MECRRAEIQQCMIGRGTDVQLLKLGEELYPSELVLEGCGSFYHTWNEWTASIQKLMGDDRARAGMDGQMIGVRNGDAVHNPV